MEAVYITGIIVFGIVLIVLAFRDRITDLFFGGSDEQGERKRKAVFRVKAAYPQKKPKGRNKSGKSYAVDISGNTRIGVEKTKVSRDGVRIANNNSLGTADIEIIGDHTMARQIQLLNEEEIQSQLLENNATSDILAIEHQTNPKILPEIEDK